jgi:hypothetical protein
VSRAVPTWPPLATGRNNGPSVIAAACSHAWSVFTGQAVDPARDSDCRALALLIGFAAANMDAQAFVAFRQVGDIERDVL